MTPVVTLARRTRRTLMAVCLALVVALASGWWPAAAQDDDPAAQIEALALRAHQQNLRTLSYTFWVGGDLGHPTNMPARSVMGEMLDNWTLSALGDDPALRARDLTRPTLFNFWASWCPPCRIEFPHLTDVALHPDAYGFDVVFVDTYDNSREALAYLEQYPPEIVTVLDENDRYARRWAIDSIPTSLLLNTNGSVLAVHVGLMTPTVTEFLSAVAANPGVGQFVAGSDLLVAPLATLLPVDPAAVDALEPGVAVEGTITNEDWQHAYRFEGRAGDTVEISLKATKGEFDAYVALLTAEGESLAENDDASFGTDSRLAVTLPADGTYIVVATRFLEAEGFDQGDYRLTVAGFTGGGADATESDTSAESNQEDGALAYGETVSGVLGDANAEDRWTFVGEAGDSVTVRMTRAVDEDGGLDGYLVLLDANGELLVEIDDSGDSVMPTITDYVLPAAGPYTIVATRYGFDQGFSAGEYSLALSVAEPAAADDVARGVRWLSPDALPDAPRWLRYNDRAIGTIAAGDVDDWYIFRGRAGDTLSITMQADTGDLDPFLLLLDAEGYELARNDDLDDGMRAGIVDFTLPASATYLVRATRYGFANGLTSGGYTLAIETEAAPLDAASDTLRPLIFANPISGRLDANQAVAAYRFEGQAGTSITAAVRRTSGDLDPALALRDPSSSEIAVGRAWLQPGEARLSRVVLPADGAYTLEVLLEDLNTAGDFDVLLLADSEPPLPATTQRIQPGADVEIILTWVGAADLDLVVTAPDGETMHPAVHGNDFCAEAAAAPLERAVWPGGTALPGLFRITVRYAFDCASTGAPVAFELVIAHQGAVVDVVQAALPGPGDSYDTLLPTGQ